MTKRTIETAKAAYYELMMYIDEQPIDEEFWDKQSALRKLKNFIDLAEKELVK